MANALPPGFQGTDFSQWGSWQPVNIDGLPYYQVPGHDQYVFDPYDGAYGSIKINPRYVEEAYNAENPEPGIVEQVVPALGTVGGLYLSNQLFNPSTATAGAEVAGQAGNSSGFFGNLFGSGAEGEALGSSAALNEGVALGDSMLASSTFDPSTASAADVFAEGGTIGGEGALGAATPALGAAGAAYGAYNMYEGLKEGDMAQTGMGAAGVGLGINAMGYALGPWGWAALAAMALASKFTKHESTREVAQKHTKSLIKQGENDPTWQNYVKGMRAQHNQEPPDKSKPFAGKYATWEDYQANGLEAPDLTGVYGNLKTFGPDWAKLSQEQRVAVTQGIINAGLYKSKKGEVEITDPSKAKTIYESVVSGAAKPESNKPIGETTMPAKKNEKQMRTGVPLMPIPQRQMPNSSAPQPRVGGAPSFGQGIAQQVMQPPQGQQMSVAGQPSMQKLPPRAQPQTDTADWMMKLRQRAMAQPQPMMGQTPPIYSRG